MNTFRRMNLPNKLTVLRMLAVPLFVACFYLDKLTPYWNVIAAAVFFIADMTDIADGYIARKNCLVTDFGKLMDPMADKLLFCSAFIMLTGIGWLSPLFTLLFVGREFVISGFRLVASTQGNVIAANWLGKAKSTVQVVAILSMLLGNPIFRLINVRFDLICMHLAAVLTVWSAIDYIVKNRKVVKSF